MTDTKHTPGPWDCEVRSYAGVKWDGIIRAATKRDPICFIFMAGYTNRESNANARLIAAAPDLLEALQFFADPQSSDPIDWRDARDAARAAVAKAEGRS